MYCKGCGKEVADDSKYCQYCGIKLTNNANATNKCSLLLSVLAKVKLSNKAKTILSHYMVWFVINMICLIFYDKNRDASDWLFPFVSTDLRDYDGSEFILTLSKILCKWEQDSAVSLFLYLDSVFKNKHKLIHNQAPVMNRLCPFLLNLHK